MDDFEAYKTYLGLKNHFSKSNSYDYIKYNGKSTVKLDTFQKRKDKIFFKKLAKKDDLVNFLVANFIKDNKIWVRDLAYSASCDTTYQNWVKYQQSLTYNFKNELNNLDPEIDTNFKVKPNEHPALLGLYMTDLISLETLIILLDVTDTTKYWDSKMEFDPVWDDIKYTIQQYKPFIKYDKDKVKQICLEYFIK